ncbi:MAG: hypothetical protein ACPG4T_05785 [Nannocystaceae bacterium]
MLTSSCATNELRQSLWVGDQLLATPAPDPTRNQFEVLVEVDLEDLETRIRSARHHDRLEFVWTLAGLGQWQAQDDSAPASVLALSVESPTQTIARDLILAPQSQAGLRIHDWFRADDGSCSTTICQRRYVVTTTWFHATAAEPPTPHPLLIRWIVEGFARTRSRGPSHPLRPGELRVRVRSLEGDMYLRTQPNSTPSDVGEPGTTPRPVEDSP